MNDQTKSITLYLIRHGENPANITKEFSHRKVDYSLNDKGHLQAQQTADYFKSTDLNIAAIYSSPLKRAIETASIIADALNLPITSMENFREVNPGKLEGMPPTKENWDFHQNIIKQWFNGNPNATFPEGENYHQLWARIHTGIQQIIEKHSAGEHVIIVGHAGAFKFTLFDLCQNITPQEVLERWMFNCAITTVSASLHNGTLSGQLLSWFSIDHLSGEALPPQRDTKETK